MSLKVHFESLKGKRKSNEDQHVIFLNADNRYKKYSAVNLFGVFDGHGGSFVSKYLKRKLCSRLVKKDLEYPLSKDYINQVYDKIQNRLETKYRRQALHCGSTCLVVIHYLKSQKQYIQVISTGDSRAAICRNKVGFPLSVDHKPAYQEEKNRIREIVKKEKSGVKIEFDGIDYRIKDLSVSRAFGDIDATPYVTHRPEIFKYKLSKAKKDLFMVVACDGLWDVLNNQDAANYVLQQMEKDKNGNIKCKDNRVNIAKKLGTHAIEEGSGDNVTSIVVFFSL